MEQPTPEQVMEAMKQEMEKTLGAHFEVTMEAVVLREQPDGERKPVLKVTSVQTPGKQAVETREVLGDG